MWIGLPFIFYVFETSKALLLSFTHSTSTRGLYIALRRIVYYVSIHYNCLWKRFVHLKNKWFIHIFIFFHKVIKTTHQCFVFSLNLQRLCVENVIYFFVYCPHYAVNNNTYCIIKSKFPTHHLVRLQEKQTPFPLVSVQSRLSQNAIHSAYDTCIYM